MLNIKFLKKNKVKHFKSVICVAQETHIHDTSNNNNKIKKTKELLVFGLWTL